MKEKVLVFPPNESLKDPCAFEIMFSHFIHYISITLQFKLIQLLHSVKFCIESPTGLVFYKKSTYNYLQPKNGLSLFSIVQFWKPQWYWRLKSSKRRGAPGEREVHQFEDVLELMSINQLTFSTLQYFIFVCRTSKHPSLNQNLVTRLMEKETYMPFQWGITVNKVNTWMEAAHISLCQEADMVYVPFSCLVDLEGRLQGLCLQSIWSESPHCRPVKPLSSETHEMKF